MRRTTLLLAAPAFLLAALPFTAWAASPGPSAHCVRNVETGDQECYDDMRLRKGSGSVILAVLFTDQEFGGRSLTLVGPRPCKDDDASDYRGDLTGQWADSVTAVQTWGNCWVDLYEQPARTGGHDGPFKEDTRYIGPLLDNRARSFTLS